MAGRRALLAVLLAGTAIVGVDCRERNGTEVDHAGSGTAPAPERTNCEKCARASVRLRPSSFVHSSTLRTVRRQTHPCLRALTAVVASIGPDIA